MHTELFLEANRAFLFKKYRKALQALNKIQNDTPETLELAGRCYEELSEDADAAASYQRAIDLDRDYAPALHRLGLMYIRSAEDPIFTDPRLKSCMMIDAKRYLDRALAIVPTNPVFMRSMTVWQEKYNRIIADKLQPQQTHDLMTYTCPRP